MSKHTADPTQCATCRKQDGQDNNRLVDCSTCGGTYCSSPCFSEHTGPKPAEAEATR